MGKYWNESMECATLDEMRALQSFRLQKTVKRVYNNVPYYRDMMDKAGVKPEDIRSVDDLHLLPFTSKQDLRDTYPYGLFACPMEDVVRLHASSGTTGKQIVVGYTRKDLDMWSDCVARALTAKTLICGATALPERSQPQAQRARTSCTFPTAMVCSQADSDCTTAQQRSA